MKVVTRDERPRPVLVTPAKGSLGDKTDETMKDGCDIGSIIQRYGGNLAEIARWRGSMSFGEQVNHNLEDNIERFKALEAQLDTLPNKPFKTLDEAFAAIADGSFVDKVSKKVEVNDEAHEGQPAEVAPSVSEDGVEAE